MLSGWVITTPGISRITMAVMLDSGCRYIFTIKRNMIDHAEETKVYVHEMSDEEIRSYIAAGESLDKAGAYGIQGRFAAFIDRIEGDYFNVMGLPVAYLYQQLKGLLD